MLKKLSYLVVVLGLSHSALAEDAFIAQEQGRILVQEGHFEIRHAPCSTFKITLALIGYDAGILVDETQPKWPFQKGYVDFLERWRQPHTPELWLKNSCVWYSQVLTQKLGMEAFQRYVNKLDYGNKDLSGDPGKNNGLTHAWLSSSLQISPKEQVVFLTKLSNGDLPLSAHAHTMTKNILFLETLADGWKLYGKTGTDMPRSSSSETKRYPHGWFVGWMEKGERVIVFAAYMEHKKGDVFAGTHAKEKAKEKLIQLISNKGSHGNDPL